MRSLQTEAESLSSVSEGFEYSMVDDGWKDWDAPWETMKALCDHARSKGVGFVAQITKK